MDAKACADASRMPAVTDFESVAIVPKVATADGAVDRKLSRMLIKSTPFSGTLEMALFCWDASAKAVASLFRINPDRPSARELGELDATSLW